jgi:glycosyltransferase involved in cell wall biosynthesis
MNSHRIKIIFLCANIKNNINSTRYQRALVLTKNFDTIIISRSSIPADIKDRTLRSYNVGNNAFSLLYTLLLILYLRLTSNCRSIHTQYNTPAIITGFVAKYFMGFVWIYDLWDHPTLLFRVDNWRRRLQKFIFHLFVFRLTAFADMWIIGMHKGILDAMPHPHSYTRIVKITNGVCEEIIHKAPTAPFSEKDKRLRICYSGFITMQRGLHLLLEYVGGSKGKLPFQIDLLGKIDKEALETINYFNDKHVNRINYIGEKTHKESLIEISKCDVCLCLLDESFLNYKFSYPIKLFEYLALGKIVIASRTPALQEVIVDGENGFLVNNTICSLDAVFAKIVGMNDKGEMEKMALAAQRTANEYCWTKINQFLETELLLLLNRKLM